MLKKTYSFYLFLLGHGDLVLEAMYSIKRKATRGRDVRKRQGKELPVVKIKRSRERDIKRKFVKRKRPEDEETPRGRDVKTLRRHILFFCLYSL